MTLATLPHKRLGCRKTTTGCRTCKRRRIKCDESRPSCKRCMKIGRECEGYEFWIWGPADGKHGILQPLPARDHLKTTPYTSQIEYQHFQYFIEGCGKFLAGFLDKRFWMQLVPQLSHTSNAVRYAVLAISCLYRDLGQRNDSANQASSSPKTCSSKTVMSSAVFWYNKAIKAVLMGQEESLGAQRMASISCLLFLCIECIQGHADEAFDLYLQGERLIRCRKDVSTIEHNELKAMFTRLRHMASLFNCTRPLPDPNQDDSGQEFIPLTRFGSLHQARDSLHIITASAHDFAVFARRCIHPSFSHGNASQAQFLELKQINHLTRLSEWLTRAHPLLHNPQALLDTHSHLTTLILLIHYHITMAILPSALSLHECAFDAHLSNFQQVVELASRAITLKTSYSKEPVLFTFEAGFILALSITALHCRHLRLRRRAIEMLEETPQQEGLWEADLMRRVCNRVIELEHAGLGEDEWPAEERRVRDAFMRPRTERADGTRGNVVRFTRMPYGIEGEEEVWDEWFEC